MTFAKLMVHAALAGLYGGCVVALFLRLANPGLLLRGPAHDPTLPVVILSCTAGSAILWPALYAALRFFASHPLRLGWLSLRYVLGFHAANLGVLLGSGWGMLSGQRACLEPKSAERLGTACWLLGAAWLFCALIAVVPGLRRRGGLQTAAALVSLLALLFPLTRSGARSRLPDAAVPASPGTARAPEPHGGPARRLILLNFDGADLDTILTMRAQGKLPAFSRLIEEGAYGRLSSIEPCAAPVTRATLVTGMPPYRHGVRGERSRRVGAGAWLDVIPPGIGFDLLLAPWIETRRPTIADRREPSLWEISARLGGAGDSAGWEIDLDAPQGAGAPGESPPPADWMADLVDPDVPRLGDGPRARGLIREVTRAARADASVFAALVRGETRDGPGVAALSFPGLDRVAHVFLRYARPNDFGNVSGRDVELYGPILERYYRRVDAIIGRALRPGSEGTLVLVTATHGMEPAPPLRRLRDEILRGEHLSGVHEGGPAGFLFAHGPDVQPGSTLARGSILDVAPTALYALGLPVARDAGGSILAGIFRETYTAAHPVTVIESYGADRRP